MAYRHLQVDGGPVATVRLNRPEAGNAMSDLTLKELAACFKALSKEPGLRAVVIRGMGKHFCSGADIEWMRRAGALPPAQGKKDAALLSEALKAVQECPVPVIVRAHGAVYGGGLGLVAACDIAVAAEDAKMCFSETRLGILPAVISLFVLPKIGAAAARRYYLTAEVFGMAAAKDMGLVHGVVPEAGLDAAVDGLVAGIRKNGPQAVRAAKALLRRLPELPSFAARQKLVIETLVRLRSSPEGQEGLSAFLEKRAPAWLS